MRLNDDQTRKDPADVTDGQGSVAHLHLLYIISILFFQKKNIDFMDIGDPFFLRPRLALIVYRSFLQRPVKT